MKNFKWIIVVSLFVTFNFILLGLVNYVVDPFKVFGSNILPYQVQMNERFVKVEFLKKNHQNFNAYIFGSSRVGVVEPSIIEQYIPDSKFYNFTLSSATLDDYEKHLSYFIKEQYMVNTLYLQLDIDNMQVYGKPSSDYLSKLHPDVVNESPTLYYLKYLVGFFPLNLREKIEGSINDKKNKEYSLEKGTWYLVNSEKRIEENRTKYLASVSGFNFKNPRNIAYTKQKENMKALQKIVDLCKENAIKLYLFTSAHNQNMMDTFILKDYNNYLRNISEISDFYDFSGYNSVTTNNFNYYEVSHYRPHVARLMAARIFNNQKVSVPNDFGKFIEKGSLLGL